MGMKATTVMIFLYVSIFSVMVGGLLLAPMATASTIPADVNIDPDKINLKETPKSWKSPYVMAFIRFLKPYKKKILDINVSTILLDGVIPVSKTELTKTVCKAFFDRQTVQDYLWLKLAHMGNNEPFKNKKVELTVTGNLNDGTPFEGSDTILVSTK